MTVKVSRMKRFLAAVTLGGALLLTGCGAPADDRQERAEQLLDAVTTVNVGEEISDAYRAEGIYEGIADDLMEKCGETGMPQAYASQIPDMETVIIQAYDITCPN
jgi:hypothetical protein